MTAYRSHSNVTVTLLDGTDGDRIAVRRGWLPMAVWEGVRVRVTSSRGLTLFERFAIECLLDLGDCGADDLVQVASIPAELGEWLLSSLVQRGIARRISQGRFIPERSSCETALAQGNLPVECEETLTFLWFPETEELVCLPGSRELVLELRDCQPVGQFPLPERWKREKRAKVLTEALQNSRVYGHEVSAIRDVLDEAVIEHETCPAYHCSTVLPLKSNGQWSVTLQGYRRQRQRRDTTSAESADRDRQIIESRLNLPVLPRVVKRWRDLLMSHAESTSGQCAGIGLTGVALNGNCWEATVNGASAGLLAERRLLARRLSVAVEIDGEIEFAVPLLFSPADASARELFSLDDTVRQVLAAPHAEQAVTSLCCEPHVTRSAVLERLWQLRLFGKVYEAREREDFVE